MIFFLVFGVFFPFILIFIFHLLLYSYSHIKYLLSTYYVPSTILSIKNTMVNKQKKKSAHIHNNGERNGNPLQYSCLEDPMDRGDWRATVRQVRGNWATSLFTFTFTLVTICLILYVCVYVYIHREIDKIDMYVYTYYNVHLFT